MTERAYFITGTDTNIGKTYVAKHLLAEFNQLGLQTLGLKPIATGALGGVENEDALMLQKAASLKIPLTDINPFVFEPAIAPHLAAKRKGIILKSATIQKSILTTMATYPADRYIIEGAGGLAVPLNDNETIADLILILNIPVLLVVGIRLGCLNHAILTSELIKFKKIPFAGWIANCIDDSCQEQVELIETLKKWLPAPWIKTFNFKTII